MKNAVKTHIDRAGQRRWTVWFVVTSLILAVLACTSSDSLIIKLTATPVPTITPTPLSSETRFKVKDKVYVIGVSFQVAMNTQPGPPDTQMGEKPSCFAGTQVEILETSKNRADPQDPMIYYKVACATINGWTPEYWLTVLNPNGSAVVKSKDGKGAKLYSGPSASSEPASSTPCADGTTVSISSITLNPDASADAPDRNIYVQVTCGNTTGYALDSELVPA